MYLFMQHLMHRERLHAKHYRNEIYLLLKYKVTIYIHARAIDNFSLSVGEIALFIHYHTWAIDGE